MKKGEFANLIASENNCTKAEAEKIIDVFTSSAMSALSKGEEISLIGFGSFFVKHVEARKGRNPRTGEEIDIAAYNQPKFKVGQKLKAVCN